MSDDRRPLRVCVSGATGSVGRLLTLRVLSTPDMQLTSAIARSAAGKTVGQVLGCESDVIIRGSIREALAEDEFDVLVDYTSASAALEIVRTAIASGVHVVAGSSGITAEQYDVLDGDARSRGVGVVHGNFAITATLAQLFAEYAAQVVKSWEIIEYGSQGKIDAVSGTAQELATRLSKFGPPEHLIAPDAFVGDTRSRGANVQGTQVHALRLPGVVFGFEIVFGKSHERLVIRHEAISHAEPYIEGTLLAIRKVSDLVGVQRGLESILKLKFS
jgi:4-hydroxy-tetrahydrodipicolinate reductase